MAEKIFIISDRKNDLELFYDILGSKGFDIEDISQFEKIEEFILKGRFDAILADYDLVGESVSRWIELLQESKSRTCFIIYGDKSVTDKISEILQRGVYAFIPRALLSERIYDVLVGGLENRKAFIEILGMIDELKDVNEKLEREKAALKKKNQEIGFINQLSSEVVYDLSWDNILPKIIAAGFLEVIDPEFLSILYRIGSKWNLAFYLSKREINKEILERLKEDIINRFFSLSGKRISRKEIDVHLYPSNVKVLPSLPISFSNQWLQLLNPAEKPLGMLAILPKDNESYSDDKKEFISTISNILSMSLNNAQEYYRLKKLTVKDSLTGVLNHKGFREFIEREFQEAKRYHNSLSLVMIDLDNFKLINDNYGHLAGDYILKEFAGCLKETLRQTDIVARCGGDEFVIILPETEIGAAEIFIKRLVSFLNSHTFTWQSQEIKVSLSYGSSMFEELNEIGNVEELIAIADSRLYHAKRSKNLMRSVAG